MLVPRTFCLERRRYLTLMSNVADWLKLPSLERYAGEFQRAEIDLKTLTKLTESDLIDPGFPLAGAGKFRAALHGDKISPEKSADDEIAVTSRAERRHVTVLFADLVGSTEIASRIDPETMGHLLADYQHVVSQEIERYGGYVAKFLGDGVMAYFGWPRAQEDAAELIIEGRSRDDVGSLTYQCARHFGHSCAAWHRDWKRRYWQLDGHRIGHRRHDCRRHAQSRGSAAGSRPAR